MAGRPRHDQYDDPYTFDDPYRNEPPSLGRNVGYEYVGTDEPGQNSASPPPRYESGRSSPPQRKHRTTSPPRSRRDGDHSPPRNNRHQRPDPRDNGPTPEASQKQAKKNYQDRYQEWAQNPGVQRAQSYGKKGLAFMGSAAAAYMASQQGNDARSRSMDRGMPSRRGSRRQADHDDPPRRRHDRRDPSYSPSPSPSPPRRPRRDHRDHGEAARSSRPKRHDSYSESPPRRRGGYDDDHVYDKRANRHHRSHSYSRSPSPSRHRDRGRPLGRSNTTGRSMSESVRGKDATARWQMAARAALEAGGVAAFRLRKEPGSWTGAKGAKVATAALGAAAMDAFIDKDPRRERGHGVKGMAENVIGGLIASKMTGVKRSKSSRYRR